VSCVDKPTGVYPSDYHILQAQLPPGSNPRDAFILDNVSRLSEHSLHILNHITSNSENASSTNCLQVADALPLSIAVTAARCSVRHSLSFYTGMLMTSVYLDLPYSQDCTTLSRNSSAKASSTRTHNSSFSSSGASTPAPMTPIEARSNVNLGMPHRKSVVGNGGRPYMPVKKSHTMPPFVNEGWMGGCFASIACNVIAHCVLQKFEREVCAAQLVIVHLND
jgi:hypothetical protein